MAGNNGFDGSNLLRGLNIGLDQDNRRLRATVGQLTERNAITIALIRALIRKYGSEGTIVLTKDEINSVNPPGSQPAFYMKNILDTINISLNPEGPTGEGQKHIITLDNA